MKVFNVICQSEMTYNKVTIQVKVPMDVENVGEYITNHCANLKLTALKVTNNSI